MRAAVVVLAALAAGVLGYGWWRTETHATFSMSFSEKAAPIRYRQVLNAQVVFSIHLLQSSREHIQENVAAALHQALDHGCASVRETSPARPPFSPGASERGLVSGSTTSIGVAPVAFLSRLPAVPA